MAIGLSASMPCVILPWLLEHKADKSRPWSQKYWVKANVWIAIFSFIGNYFWTHYFYALLGAAYTFPSWRLNEVRFTQHLQHASSESQNTCSANAAKWHIVCCSSSDSDQEVWSLQVPITLYFMTHAYFCFYHALSNVVLRRVLNAYHGSGAVLKYIMMSSTVFVLAFITAFMETFTIAHFPYYSFKVSHLFLHYG